MKVSKPKKQVVANLPIDFFNIVVKEAEKEKLSINAYLIKMLKQNIDISEYDSFSETSKDENKKEGKKTMLVLDEETSSLLHEKATSHGITDTAYVRNLIHTKDFKVYHVQTENIDEFANDVHKAVSSLSSTISLIKKYGNGQVFEQDVLKIQKDADEIKNLLRKIVANLYGTRRAAQQKLINKYKSAD